MSHPAEVTEVAWSNFSSLPLPSPSFSSSGCLSQFSVSEQWSNQYTSVSLEQLWFYIPLRTLQCPANLELRPPCWGQWERKQPLPWKSKREGEQTFLLSFYKPFPLRITFISPWEIPYHYIKMIHSIGTSTHTQEQEWAFCCTACLSFPVCVSQENGAWVQSVTHLKQDSLI